VEPAIDRFVHVHPGLASASSALARHLSRRAREAVRARGRFSWVVAGGHTPAGLYERLAREYRRRFPWQDTDVFFGDERCVGPRALSSNYRMVWESLLSRVPVPRQSVHRMRGELRPASAAARDYARALGPIRTDGATSPRFDVVLLGMGPDGHTASLFPRAEALRERRRSVVAVRRAGQPPFLPRLTLTLPALASSREVCFLVVGHDKAKAIASIFRSFPRGTRDLPASLVRSQGPTHWFLDRTAAAGLSVAVSPTPSARSA
jgi:6-phosphogluconolactonase